MHVPEGEHEYARRRYLTQVRRLYDVMEMQLSRNEHLAGEAYSIADIASFPWAGRFHNVYEVPLDSYPAVTRWKDAIRGRPAFERIRDPVNDLGNSELALMKSADADAVDRFMGRGRYARV